ncbi:GNAT family N-acetyltransferase [Hasllibacter sp. MH4015]|uniref:GNAT family N-acetyltransferase n=1 Tax=Hasllibacter sp. MH4015 TaxID=2854029 RepID=UPI001CD61407|nr:GNAT family N-acetyltransferase [Hasllibacter sp. MH4015]
MALSHRPLTAADAEVFAALRLEGIEAFPEAFLLTAAEARSAPPDRVAAQLDSGRLHGCFDGVTLIGFGGLEFHPWAMASHRAHIGPFYVTGCRHGSDAALSLMAYFEDLALARGVTQLELWVAAANTRARAFYTKLGYRGVGQMPAAVVMDGTPRDDIFMVRTLSEPRPTPGPDGMRRLGPGDWKAFHDIRTEMLTLATHSFGTMPAEWAARAPDEVVDWMGKTHLWAVVEGGRVLSCLGWHRFPGQVQAHRGHIVAVYTRPEARQKGHFRALLNAAKAEAADDGIIQFELDVGADNKSARAAYEAHGFTVTGGIPRALNHGGHIHNQLYMVCPLANG